MLMIICKQYQLHNCIFRITRLTVKSYTDVGVNGRVGTCPMYNCAQYTLHEQVVREFELDSSTVRSVSLLAINEG